MSDTRTAPADPDLLLRESEHFVCCHHEHRTFCGMVDHEPWDGTFTNTVSCAACMAADHLDRTLYGCTWCPVDGVCTHVNGTCSCSPEVP